MSRSPLTPIQRVLSRSVAGPGGCVLWCGAKTPTGYGQIGVDGRRVSVHRISYQAFHGVIPLGLEVDHICRVRHCVNPYHLQAVTHAENVRRAIRKVKPLRVNCRNGHPMTEGNTYLRPDGKTDCKDCKRVVRTRSKKKRAAMTVAEIAEYCHQPAGSKVPGGAA